MAQCHICLRRRTPRDECTVCHAHFERERARQRPGGSRYYGPGKVPPYKEGRR